MADCEVLEDNFAGERSTAGVRVGMVKGDMAHFTTAPNELLPFLCDDHGSNSPVHDPLFMLYFSSFLSLHQQHAGHKFKLDLA
jgi:hypothetical protein